MGEMCCSKDSKNNCTPQEMEKKCMMKSIGLLFVRLALMFFIYHGYMKFTHMDATIGFFSSIGIPMPQIMAYVVASIELFGGIAVLLGLFSRVGGVLLACVMAVAFLSNLSGGIEAFELDLVFLFSALGIVFLGPGKYSLKAVIAKKCNCGGNCPICKF